MQRTRSWKAIAVVAAIVMSCLFTSCGRQILSVHSDYVARESLASYWVDTPDPLLNCPPFGQRLVVSWSVPSALLKLDNPHLEITIRMRNREQIVRHVPVKRRCGTTLYRILNDRYCETGGFLTYKVQLIAGGCIYEEWRHQLWAEIIAIDNSEEDEEDAIDFID